MHQLRYCLTFEIPFDRIFYVYNNFFDSTARECNALINFDLFI